MKLAEVFGDPEVARLYACRPPYPAEVFTVLRRLLVAPGTVLDAGAGTGALARRMVSFADRIDAVDPSAAMIAAARHLPEGSDGRIRWIVGRAEDAPLAPPYGLITCGASLHWMDLDVVLPRFRDALAPGAVVAIADTENVHGPYHDDVLRVSRAYSEIEHHRETVDVVEDLVAAGPHRDLACERQGAYSFPRVVWKRRCRRSVRWPIRSGCASWRWSRPRPSPPPRSRERPASPMPRRAITSVSSLRRD